ncbi:hypothetical protein CTAYLR_009792 [Chrysophaeum taylorii]|uniref:Uncharacterized protein n=1 Tax=Chrysophaeum taylorii TaxID=2483200 RepID=A0AAD7UMD6_9STRA|nr:hypothetical protein CTAYLR_009792 [Chrysophaeum taylorii]
MACNALCCCFSGEPLTSDDTKGRRGEMYAKYVNYTEKFQISMGDAPCKACPCCCIGGCPLTFVCAQHHMRYKVLNHVAPGSGWDNYICCQGYFPACCCFNPGACCEKELPRTCMCCEVCCCPGLAVSSTRFVMMDHYRFTPDECDNRLIRFNNCIQLLSCICHILAIFNREFRECAQIIDLIADIVFFSTAGCMTAQVDYEIKYRDSLTGPVPISNPADPTAPPTATVVAVNPPPPKYPGAPPVADDIDR